MRPQFLLVPLLALTGCGEEAAPEGSQGSTTPPYIRPEPTALPSDRVQPVRVGELGAAFAACAAQGTTRDRVTDGSVPVFAAPFEGVEQIDQLEAGARFFICSRSHDQRWFGVVYDEDGTASERCGVSRPAERSIYRGPCAAGWVSSASVRLDSGITSQVPTAAPEN